MTRLSVRSIVIQMAIIFALLPVPVLAQTTVNAGYYKGNVVERVEIWNANSGLYDYLYKVFPNDGKPSRPLVLFNNPYAIVAGSNNSIDKEWVAKGIAAPSMYPDVSLAQSRKFYQCNGDCTIFVTPASNDISNLGNVFGEIQGDSLFDKLFDEGYGVAVLLNGHYRGSDSVSLMIGVQNTIISLSKDPRVEKLVILGISQGGQLSIHPLTFPRNVPGSVASDDPRFIGFVAGAVSIAGWMEPSEMWRHMDKDPAFYNPFKNRWATSFGTNPGNWGAITYDSLASRFYTPLLMIHSTDDCMVPVDQASNFLSAIKSRGKLANAWIYSNGACNTNVPITSSAHGKLDQGINPDTGGPWATNKMTLIRNFIRAKMSLGKDVLANGDVLPAMLDEFAKAHVMSNEKTNIAELVTQACNPRIKYVSSNPRFNGYGDKVVPVLWEEAVKFWQSKITIVRVPEDYDIPSLFRGYVLEYFLPWTSGARRAQIVASVSALARPEVTYVSSDPNFPSAKGDIFIRSASDRALWEFFTAYRNR